ncbi:MAG: N-acetylornithine carbamoyltransferase [Gemmatimonadales bacterium]|nr:N-acetylornithine carbamoyltransferase [Gemmatimonadales bacterium]MBP9200002.1 N-acetylornithine carbamoyltransferase [Gemmatimonadales bacterium]
MTKRDFITVEDWSAEEIDALLALAAKIKRGEVLGGLERKVMAMVFMDPSMRTRTSFETAMYLHGGHAVVLEPGKSSWSLETEMGAVMDGTTVEHLKDAARVLGRYADVVGVRSFPRGDDWASVREDRIIRDFARYCEKPVINMESTRRHPCQQLADAMTLREKLGDPRGKRFVLLWAWHPKALPTAVPASAALAAAHQGMEIVIARPDGYELDQEDTALIRRIAQARGGEFVHIINDPDEALVGADVVYVKSWGAVKQFGKPEEEAALRRGLRDWRLTAPRLRSTRGGKATVMHCLPVRRNVEIDDAVLDGPASAVVDEAENRLHVQRALLLELIGGR